MPEQAALPRVTVIGGEAFEFVHDCDAMCGDGVRRFFPARSIPLDSRWVTSGPDEAATLGPSIQCLACGVHGHWRNGRWEPV